MSRVVVVRHAKSDYPWGVSDHDRPLNDRGRRDAPMVGEWLDANLTWEGAVGPIVVVSTATRAQLTWGRAAERLSERWASVERRDESRIYEAPVSDLVDVVRETGQETDTVILVGHNPGVAALVWTLAQPSGLRDEACQKFPTSAVAVLESAQPLATAVDEPGAFTVTHFVVPRG